VEPVRRVDGRARRADHPKGSPAVGETLDLRLDRVDDLDLQVAIEQVEVAGPRDLDDGV